MLFIDNPRVLLDVEVLLPSEILSFHENMNVIARGIIIIFAFLAMYTKQYHDYAKYGLLSLGVLAVFIHIVEMGNDINIEGLSPTKITHDTTTRANDVVHRSPNFEADRGRGFFKESNPFQGPRPQPNKNKISGLYFDDF